MRILLDPAAPAAASGGAATVTPPAAPAAPAAASLPAPGKEPDKGNADPFADLDAELAPEKLEAAPKLDDKAKDKVDPKAKVEDKAKAADDKLERTLQKETPKALREYADRTKRENEELRQRLSEFERKTSDFETKAKESTKLTERIATLERERDAIQGELRAAKQETSPEFKAKFDQPFHEAAEFAKKTIEGLEVIEQQGEDGQPNKTRPATWDDFRGLYNMPLNKASKLARAAFGDDAQTVINHLNELQRLDFARGRALETEKAQWKQNTEREVADRQKQQEAVSEMWQQVNRDLANKEPEFFQPDPKDTEAAALFTKSLNLVDSTIAGNGLTMEQKVVADANVRLRAAAFPVVKLRLTKANARIAELEGKLAEKENAGPEGHTTRAAGGTAPPAEKGYMEELDEVLKEP